MNLRRALSSLRAYRVKFNVRLETRERADVADGKPFAWAWGPQASARPRHLHAARHWGRGRENKYFFTKK